MNFKVTFVLFFVFLSAIKIFAQSQSDSTLHNKITLGGWVYSDSKSILASYCHIRSDEDELSLQLNYVKNENEWKAILITGGYNLSCIPRRSKFDLFVAFECHYIYEWYSNTNTEKWHSGLALGFGLAPLYNFNKHLVVSFEINAAYGYQWANNESIPTHVDPSAEQCLDCGVFYLYTNTIKVGYKF